MDPLLGTPNCALPIPCGHAVVGKLINDSNFIKAQGGEPLREEECGGLLPLAHDHLGKILPLELDNPFTPPDGKSTD
eukprot:8244050-Karenia_brevis.AAC.1